MLATGNLPGLTAPGEGASAVGILWRLLFPSDAEEKCQRSRSRATSGQLCTPQEGAPAGGASLRSGSLLQAAPSPSSNDRDAAKKAL